MVDLGAVSRNLDETIELYIKSKQVLVRRLVLKGLPSLQSPFVERFNYGAVD